MQARARRGARAGNITRILRDLGFYQNDIEHNRPPLYTDIYYFTLFARIWQALAERIRHNRKNPAHTD